MSDDNKLRRYDDLLEAEGNGTFSPETLEIRILISDIEIDDVIAAQQLLINQRAGKTVSKTDVEEAQRIFRKFMQTHNHELAHFYQILALPTFQLIWASRFNWFKLETVALLKAFDAKKTIDLNENSSAGSLLTDSDRAAGADLFQAFELYQYIYRHQTQGISVEALIEGMAHIMSLQLSDTPDTDSLSIENNAIYTAAFQHLTASLDGVEIETRWKLLLFSYYCYFSLHSKPQDVQSATNPVQVFLNFCTRAPHHAKVLKDYHATFAKMAPADLSEKLGQWFTNRELSKATPLQKASVYSFFTLIPSLKSEAEAWGIDVTDIEVEDLNRHKALCDEKGLHWSNEFLLARMLIIPSNFVWVREVYDAIQDRQPGEVTFSFSEQALFYEFIKNCRQIFTKDHIMCCERHGVVDGFNKTLTCQEPGGFAYTFERLTGRRLREVFEW